MARWYFRLFLLVTAVGVMYYAYSRAVEERVCYYTDKCEERIRGLNVQLEFYSNDMVLQAEKESGKTSERRAYYPADLDELVHAEKDENVSEDTVCPIYGVKYKYVQLEGGTSYLAYCPARHFFHFDDQPFVNAITPEQSRLHLFVSSGKVYDLEGEHPNPWDFHTPMRVAANASPFDSKNPTYAIVPTDISADLIQMLPQNPPRITRW